MELGAVDKRHLAELVALGPIPIDPQQLRLVAIVFTMTPPVCAQPARTAGRYPES